MEAGAAPTSARWGLVCADAPSGANESVHAAVSASVDAAAARMNLRIKTMACIGCLLVVMSFESISKLTMPRHRSNTLRMNCVRVVFSQSVGGRGGQGGIGCASEARAIEADF
jgi:hypothetical protein